MVSKPLGSQATVTRSGNLHGLQKATPEAQRQPRETSPSHRVVPQVHGLTCSAPCLPRAAPLCPTPRTTGTRTGSLAVAPGASSGAVPLTSGFLGGSMRCGSPVLTSSPRSATDLSATCPASLCQVRCRGASPTAMIARPRQLSPRALLTCSATSQSSSTPAAVAAVAEISRLRRDAAPLLKHTSTLGAAFRNLAEAEALHRRVHGSASADLLKGLATCLVRAAAAELKRSAEDGAWYDVAPGLPPCGCVTGRALAAARADLALDFLERTPMAALSGEAFSVLDQLQPTRCAKIRARIAETN